MPLHFGPFCSPISSLLLSPVVVPFLRCQTSGPGTESSTEPVQIVHAKKAPRASAGLRSHIKDGFDELLTEWCVA
ncbi:protein of unknown function [Pararobbsia alpina]